MNGELRLNLPMITDNDKFFQKHYITRTLFIIIQIIGKNKKLGKYTFFRTNETYSTCQHVAIAASKHQWFYNTSNWSGYICLVKNLNTNSAA